MVRVGEPDSPSLGRSYAARMHLCWDSCNSFCYKKYEVNQTSSTVQYPLFKNRSLSFLHLCFEPCVAVPTNITVSVSITDALEKRLKAPLLAVYRDMGCKEGSLSYSEWHAFSGESKQGKKQHTHTHKSSVSHSSACDMPVPCGRIAVHTFVPGIA